MLLTLHHLENSQSFRIVWLLEELQTLPSSDDVAPLPFEYKIKLYKRDPSGLAPPEYKAISPLGTSPTITVSNDDDDDEKEEEEEEEKTVNANDGNIKSRNKNKNDGTSFALSESNAIIDYILDMAANTTQQQGQGTWNKKVQELRPEKHNETNESLRKNYLFWFHTCSSSFMFLMSTDSIFRTILKKVGFILAPLFGFIFGKVHQSLLDPRLVRIMELTNEQLSNHDYLAGDDFTAADIVAIYPFDAALSRYPNFGNDYPYCKKWLQRMYERPAFQNALQKIGEETISLQV